MSCNDLLSTKGKAISISHKVTIIEDHAHVWCFYCQEKQELGSLDQGIKSFKCRIQSNKRSQVVLTEIDGKNFELRDDAIFCLPCKKMFSGDNLISNLKHNISQHEKTPCHQQKLSNVKNTRHIGSFFQTC